MTQETREKTIYRPLGVRIWETGRPFARGPMVDGLRHGPWVFWYASGKRQMAGSYRAGKKEGPWTKWWENGNTASEGHFSEGRMHGRWMDFFPEGKPSQSSEWFHGRKSGKWTIWDRETGAVLRQETYDPAREEQMHYTLLTDREMEEAVRRRQRLGVNKAWEVLVGRKVARYLEPWHVASWVLLFVPIYVFFQSRMAVLSVLLAPALTSLACIALVLSVKWHDHHTRPDCGVKDE